MDRSFAINKFNVPRKLEIEGTSSAIFVIKTSLLFFCVPNVVNLYDFQISTIKHISVDSIKFEFGNKEKV